jgi:threonylcarbamoyladenosine tRNA methylthiotransferase MtaB
MRRVTIETHGCKLNQADTQNLVLQFADAGMLVVGPDDEVDVYILNSCTVTHVADRKARHALNAARRRYPKALIIATGCYAERDAKELKRQTKADLILGNRQKGELVNQVAQMGYMAEVDDPGESAAYLGSGLRTRAAIKIQEGCNQVCAYCIVPRVRGRERSVPPDDLIYQVNSRIAAGYREVILTGTQLGSYGFDLKNIDLAGLIHRILKCTKLERLRVSSLQPQEVSEDLLHLWQNPRLCPHFHLPLQSGSDDILRRMRRRYTAQQYTDAIKRIRKVIPNCALTTDVIVGFPGESTQDFENTYKICKETEFAGLHIFPYSKRPGTSAAHFMGDVDGSIKRQRMQWMLDLARRKEEAFLRSQLGTVRPVLWEQRSITKDITTWIGHTDNYVRVATYSPQMLQNHVTNLRLERIQNRKVWGELVQENLTTVPLHEN